MVYYIKVRIYLMFRKMFTKYNLHDDGEIEGIGDVQIIVIPIIIKRLMFGK